MNTNVKIAWITVFGAVVVALIGPVSSLLTKKDEQKLIQPAQPITISNNIQNNVEQNNTRLKEDNTHKRKMVPESQSSLSTQDYSQVSHTDFPKSPTSMKSKDSTAKIITNTDVWKESSPIDTGAFNWGD